MKRYVFFFIVAVAAMFIFSCKSSKNEPSPSSANSYLSVAKGSIWTYKDVITYGDTYKLTVKMTGEKSILHGVTYYNAASSYDKKGPGIQFFHVGDHTYSTRITYPDKNITFEVQLVNDTASVGYSWTTVPTDSGLLNWQPVTSRSVIKGKNLTRAVNGKTFTNVIFTQTEVDVDTGMGYDAYAIYDIYVAKGVGLIELNTIIYYDLYSGLQEKQTITGYSIK